MKRRENPRRLREQPAGVFVRSRLTAETTFFRRVSFLFVCYNEGTNRLPTKGLCRAGPGSPPRAPAGTPWAYERRQQRGRFGVTGYVLLKTRREPSEAGPAGRGATGERAQRKR